MTAQKNRMVKTDPIIFHTYREVLRDKIFVDDNDYNVFLDFLKDYFSNRAVRTDNKKTFTVRGRIYKGLPHQPQNYFNQLELLAYKLEPNRFDLLVKGIIPGSFEKFIRAISTRYAIYINKKYNREGPLFKGPYSVQEIKDLSSLLHLTRNLHSNFNKKGRVPPYFYSSYPEYLGLRQTTWVKSEIVLSMEGVDDYKSFVEGTIGNKITVSKTQPTKPQTRIPELILASFIFTLLSTLSVIRIETHAKPVIALSIPIPSPLVLGEEKESPIETVVPTVKPTTAPETENPPTEPPQEDKILVVIKIEDNSESVNLRQNPTVYSQKIGDAKEGDIFEFISESSGWYEIKLDDGSTGYVSSRYSKIRKGEETW